MPITEKGGAYDIARRVREQLDACADAVKECEGRLDAFEEDKHPRSEGGKFGSGGGKSVCSPVINLSGGSGSHRYNRESVEAGIRSSERRGGKVGGKERRLIHALLRGRD